MPPLVQPVPEPRPEVCTVFVKAKKRPYLLGAEAQLTPPALPGATEKSVSRSPQVLLFMSDINWDHLLIKGLLVWFFFRKFIKEHCVHYVWQREVHQGSVKLIL